MDSGVSDKKTESINLKAKGRFSRCVWSMLGRPDYEDGLKKCASALKHGRGVERAHHSAVVSSTDVVPADESTRNAPKIVS